MASALAWWEEAGVDMLVAETPRDWFARAPATRAPLPAVDAPAAPVPDALPDTLEAFVAWRLAAPGLPDSALARLAPAGTPGADLMLVVDRPEADEAELLSGIAGRLLDRMLAAIGRDRASAYLAPLAHGWSSLPPSPADQAALATLLRRHVALAAPARLLVLGDAASRAMIGSGVADARGGLHALNLDGVTVSAVASYHPRLLLDRPALKAAAWQDLQLLMENAPS